jgi:hypothetical protein
MRVDSSCSLVLLVIHSPGELSPSPLRKYACGCLRIGASIISELGNSVKAFRQPGEGAFRKRPVSAVKAAHGAA